MEDKIDNLTLSDSARKEALPEPGKIKLQKFISIEYPGVVENVDKALESLGGINKISEVYRDESRRMELRFRPNDLYCKPACGERCNSMSILIKVIKRTKKNKKNDLLPSKKETYEVKPLGVIQTTYKFENLCDFQFLPYVDRDGMKECIYKDLLPQGITSSKWLDDPAPLYLPPATFSRMDSPQDYRFRKDNNEGKTKVPQNVISRTRQKRTHFAVFQSFKEDGVPVSPLKGAVAQIRYKLMDSDLYQSLKEEFNRRPIWSKNALRVRLKFTKDTLKYLLPTIAYYFPTGPWRNLWVVFGYDPRKNPNSWLYQTFDFRIRQSGGSKSKVQAKRSSSNYILPYKSVQHAKKKTSVITSFNIEEETEEVVHASKNFEGISENYYLFRPGMVPPYRQMFYQYCDIQVDEIQTILESSILTSANAVCTEKNGWLPPGVEIQCRDILSGIIKKTLSQKGETAEQKFLEKELLSNSEDSSEEEI